MTTSDHHVHLEWGLQGMLSTAANVHAAVIVDVLSFSTCVDVACARGAHVLPCALDHDEAKALAQEQGATLAARRGASGPSLSPASLQALASGARLVLPSPNGSALSQRCAAPAVYAGCLRNAKAVAQALAQHAGPVVVVAAGEKWLDGSLRVALEDLLGAGAIITALNKRKSPEAQAAEAAFLLHRAALHETLLLASSGIELLERGFGDDIAIASALDVSAACPRLIDGAYRNMNS